MSERKEGWYWVIADGEWEPSYCNGTDWSSMDDEDFEEIGPRIPAPGEAPPIGQRYRNEAGEVVAVVVPASITAEIGHKAALIGEFKETITLRCCECDGSGEDGLSIDGTCADCEGAGEYGQAVSVSWSTIKDIHQAMLAALSEPGESQ